MSIQNFAVAYATAPGGSPGPDVITFHPTLSEAETTARNHARTGVDTVVFEAKFTIKPGEPVRERV